MHLPNRNHKTDDGPVYARRQTPEEIQVLVDACNGVTGPCAADQYPTPITGGEIRERVEAGEEGWGPGWVAEPIWEDEDDPDLRARVADPGSEMAPPVEVADAEAEKNFHRRNALHAVTRRILDDAGFLIPVSALNEALEEEGESTIEVVRVDDLHKPGAKADNGKLDYTLVPTELEEAVCEILMFGAKKYSRDGWRSVPNAHIRYLAALERHIKAFKRGEDCDPESGLHHLAHAACNLAFLLHFLRNGQDVGSWRFDEERYNGA